MRARAFGTAVRLERNLCLSRFCLFSVVWELIAAPAPARRSCILACDPRSSGDTVSVGQRNDIERSSRKTCVDDNSELQFFQPDCRVSSRVSSQVAGSCEGRIRSAMSATTQLPSEDIAPHPVHYLPSAVQGWPKTFMTWCSKSAH